MRKILWCLLLVPTLFLNAQSTGEDDWGAWYMYFGTNTIAEKLSIHTEAQFRYYETTSNFNQLLLRTGLNYHLNPNAIATIGYGYIDTDPTFIDVPPQDAAFNGNTIIEHRIFQQFILKNQVGKVKFEHRYRLEQRFIKNKDLSRFGADVKDTQHRARYRLQLTLPLSDTFFLNFYDEVFLNLQDSVFGQNRLYGAIGAYANKNLSFQLGYLKNHFNQINFDRLQIGVFYNTDLRKKNKEPAN